MRLTDDNPGETQNISSRESLRNPLANYRRFPACRVQALQLRTRNFDYRVFIRRRWENRDGNRVYSSPLFLIIRAREHHREIIAAERNVPR